MANKNAKIVRGAGTVELYNLLHKINDVKRMPISYKGNNGAIAKQPDYQVKHMVQGHGGQMVERQVQWTVHEKQGLDGYLKNWKNYLDAEHSYPTAVIASIKQLRCDELYDMMDLAIRHGRAMIAATTYSVYRDAQVKLYHYNGDRKAELREDGTMNYQPLHMGFQNGWKHTMQMNGAEAQELREWLHSNKTIMDLMEAKAKMMVAENTHKQLLANRANDKTRHEHHVKAYDDYLAGYDEVTTQYLKVGAWLKDAPNTHEGKPLSDSAMADITRRFFSRAPEHVLASLKANRDASLKRFSKTESSLEAYSMMDWGEEE